jgi:hypothetical protein
MISRIFNHVYPVYPVKNIFLISAFHDLNPSGGFPSGTIQFYHRAKIVISAFHGLNPSGGFLRKPSNSAFRTEL